MEETQGIETTCISMNDIFDDFKIKSGLIMDHHFVTKKLFQEETNKIEKYISSLEQIGKTASYRYSFQKYYFQNYQTGELVHYGEKQYSVDEHYKLSVITKNKQYQWLFVEMYEEFEIFLQKVYAFLGFNNYDIWPLSDYGNIVLSEMNKKTFEWYLNQTKNKKDNHSILERIRNKCQKLHYLELNNSFNKNLKLVIILFEQFRHVIVHKKGIVSDKRIFIEDVLKKSGLYNNGKYSEEHYRFCNSFFFGKGEYENYIFFLEIEKHPDEFESPYHDTFQLIMNYLLSYANIIYDTVADFKK